MTNYIKTNFDYWDREYHSPNVESFIFRLKSYLLDKHFPKNKKLTMLDFGCGQGSTIKYFIIHMDTTPMESIFLKKVSMLQKKIFQKKDLN